MDKEFDFGFKKVSETEKRNMVYETFDSVTNNYDSMNDMMSMYMHRMWKKKFVEFIPKNKNINIIDVATGTCDLVKYMRKNGVKGRIYALDQNQSMLSLGFKKLVDLNLFRNTNFICADAEKIPYDDNFFDLYTISFGIRNVTNLGVALQEAHRILKPGGKFLCMEFSSVENKFLDKLYDFYSFNIIPKLGDMLFKKKEEYQYLVESIKVFIDSFKLIEEMSNMGFKLVNKISMTYGVVSIYEGIKI